ncbi:Gfo/Idh/MocA family oxidoreductase [uncultured Novosphingobium sp.]|uniref:Gfo/Idh/MocA family protein n=1 Tax=Novosphingobium fluoreni TaxID=1391222 RepID=UPI00258FCD90|nr:Gfo/Idh/MocA family oxidoreductase [uncultured Novosphingobium sp.]
MNTVRFAMIGGGTGAFIGPVHRTAAAIAGNCQLVSGAFSRDAASSVETGESLGLNPSRCHSDWRKLIATESRLPENERAQFIAIVAPNNVHAPAAIAALEAGFSVLVEKPLANTFEAASAIRDAAARAGKLCGVTHPYIAYPMAMEARRLIAEGALGPIRRVAVHYVQGWLANVADGADKQAAWRLDPAQSGIAGAFGDIGTHAFNLVERLTGEQITHLCADLRVTVPGRALDDDGAALFRLSGGGSGTIVASQVCAGEANGLIIAIWGEKGALHWNEERPDRLRFARGTGPQEIWSAGVDRPYLGSVAKAATRLPAGHPEGFFEALANIYRDFASTVAGKSVSTPAFASLRAGIRAMAFVQAAVKSSAAGAWVSINDQL